MKYLNLLIAAGLLFVGILNWPKHFVWALLDFLIAAINLYMFVIRWELDQRRKKFNHDYSQNSKD